MPQALHSSHVSCAIFVTMLICLNVWLSSVKNAHPLTSLTQHTAEQHPRLPIRQAHLLRRTTGTTPHQAACQPLLPPPTQPRHECTLQQHTQHAQHAQQHTLTQCEQARRQNESCGKPRRSLCSARKPGTHTKWWGQHTVACSLFSHASSALGACAGASADAFFGGGNGFSSGACVCEPLPCHAIILLDKMWLKKCVCVCVLEHQLPFPPTNTHPFSNQQIHAHRAPLLQPPQLLPRKTCNNAWHVHAEQPPPLLYPQVLKCSCRLRQWLPLLSSLLMLLGHSTCRSTLHSSDHLTHSLPPLPPLLACHGCLLRRQ